MSASGHGFGGLWVRLPNPNPGILLGNPGIILDLAIWIWKLLGQIVSEVRKQNESLFFLGFSLGLEGVSSFFARLLSPH